MRAEDILKTIFWMRYRCYEFLVILFRLTNASTVVYGTDEQSLPRLSRQVHYRVHRRYPGLLEHPRGSRDALVIGSREAVVEKVVC